jgi:hypothetical protein
MSRTNPVIRLSVALSIAALIGAQIPVRSGTALAKDGYPDKTKRFGTALSVGLLGVGLVGAFRRGGGGTVIPVPQPKNDPCKPATSIGDSARSLFDILGSDPRSSFAGVRTLFGECDEVTESLKTDAPFTLLAPQDGELRQMSPQSLALLKADKDKLCEFLKDHIIIGRYTYEELCRLADGKRLLLLSGNSVVLHNIDGKVTLGGVDVVPLDVQASNGLIHPIKGLIRTNMN